MRQPHRRPASYLLLLLIAIACQPQESAPPGDARAASTTVRDTTGDRAAVAAAIDKHWTAISTGDTLAVMNHHTSDMTFIGPESKERVVLATVSPATTALWRTFKGAKAEWTPRDVQIRLLGDVAVATFYNDGSVTSANGKVDREPRKVTEVWVRESDGSWKEAHHHDSRVSQ